jgi:hypothetical protein
MLEMLAGLNDSTLDLLGVLARHRVVHGAFAKSRQNKKNIRLTFILMC